MKWRILKYFSIFIVAIFIACGVGGSLLVAKYYNELPNISEMIENYTPPIPTIIYDRNGKTIDIISTETRELVDLDDVPKNLQNAFIAVEDRRFLTHNGIDPVRILGSTIVNLKTGKTSQGGSTITQQLARNAFLTHDKKFSRKIKEILITFEIERHYTKDEIMEKYLNEIYFGSGAYGVQSAAHNFYRKDVKNINLAEAAILAGIPNRPNMYNPRLDLQRSLSRQRLILSQMLKYGFINQEEYDNALKQKFVSESKATPQDYKDKDTTIIYGKNDKKIVFNAPDFTDLVTKFLFENFDENQIYKEGLSIHTTLDLDIQESAKNAFENYPRLKNDKNLQGAMVTIDAKNGEIISIIAGKNHKIGNFNRATQAKRQLGSSFKPFIYFTGLEKGYEENLVIEDSRVNYGTWAPRNFGEKYYSGMTLMQGFDISQNIVSIKLLDKVGIPALMDTMNRIDAGFVIPQNLTAALGTIEGSPLQLTQAYAPFANGGYTVKPFFILNITDKAGNVVYEGKPQIEQKFDSADISLMTNMMKSSVKQGTSKGAEVKLNGIPIDQGGKTGTTNNSRTVWYSGITPDYITTIYIGYDNNTPISSATGGGTAAPLWKSFYQDIIDKGYYKPTTFTFLDNHIKNGDLLYETLDPLTGLLDTTGNGKTFLLRRGRMSVEKDKKFASGISGVLGYPISIKNVDANGVAVLIEESDNEISITEQQKPKIEPAKSIKQDNAKSNSENKKQGKGLLQRIFKF